jgi:hypothetical protein
MPSIEIVCIGQTKPLDCSNYPFAVEASAELFSHRSPSPRFQPDFDGLAGVIYHLGNPDLKVRDQGAFFAYDLLSEASRHAEPPSALEFAPQYASAVFDLLGVLVRESPQSELLFTSDWQFGPDHTLRLGRVSPAELRALHDSGALLLNALYTVHAG